MEQTNNLSAKDLFELGEKSREEEKYKEALNYYLQSLTFFQKSDDKENSAITWLKIAITKRKLYQYLNSNKYYEKAFSAAFCYTSDFCCYHY